MTQAYSMTKAYSMTQVNKKHARSFNKKLIYKKPSYIYLLYMYMGGGAGGLGGLQPPQYFEVDFS